MTDARSTFLALLYAQPLRRADVIVVLCGEDAMARAEVALQLFKQGAAPTILCSGGKHDGKRWLGAAHVAGWLMGQGVAPDRMLTEQVSQNTHEQAEEFCTLADANGWKSALLVASAYHLPRAFLTFAFLFGAPITPVAATPPWCSSPPGCDQTRFALLATEFEKIETYGAREHVASYQAGIAYLSQGELHGQDQAA